MYPYIADDLLIIIKTCNDPLSYSGQAGTKLN